jgi:predicted Rossmann-fold nucleotide-binding protein
MRVSVIGGSSIDDETRAQAREVGRLLGERGHTVVCGGLGGVMEAVCRGAREPEQSEGSSRASSAERSRSRDGDAVSRDDEDGQQSSSNHSADRASGRRGGETASNGTAPPSRGPREDGDGGAASREPDAKTIGILPTGRREDANEWVTTPIATDMGNARNPLVVLNGDAVIAIDGAAGTLSELGHALDSGRPVAGLDTHDVDLDGFRAVDTPRAAVDYVESAVGQR